ncbi:MAG: hypothetical protein E3J87_10130 [Candidatus Cloacimonadota bacterium]|nr:MAG: hypothetical protein E3J87_10130 [Candidatus Cloacimonadota bacterium]
MKWKTFFVCALLFLFFASCAEELTEQKMKRDIQTWWGAKEISDVIIEDYLEEDTLLTVLSRLVVAGNTTVRMSYEFRKHKKGWKLAKGPVDERTKQFCIQEMSESPFKKAREAVLKANMRNLQSVLEIIYVERGSYPSSIVTGDSIMNENILHYFQRIKNPYFSDKSPFIDALGDTGEWFPEYTGKVIYYAWVEEDEIVSHYLLRAANAMGFIDLLMGVWGEEY